MCIRDSYGSASRAGDLYQVEPGRGPGRDPNFGKEKGNANIEIFIRGGRGGQRKNGDVLPAERGGRADYRNRRAQMCIRDSPNLL